MLLTTNDFFQNKRENEKLILLHNKMIENHKQKSKTDDDKQKSGYYRAHKYFSRYFAIIKIHDDKN